MSDHSSKPRRKKTGPKKQNRVPIYPRVSKANQQWVKKMAHAIAKKEKNFSEALFVDRVLTSVRQKLSTGALRKRVNG